MANNLMSGTLSSIIKEQVMNAISKGDTALANAWGQKKFNDCVQALFQGFRKLATSNCAMSGDDSLIGSAAIHWYTDDACTIDSIADILKGGTEVLKMETPKATAPSKASKTKAEPKPKAAAPKAEPKPKAAAPKAEPKPKTPTLPPMQVVKAPTLPPAQEEEEDWFD